MSETTESMRQKINRAADLQSVVRTMKALAASQIGQYKKSVVALADYYRTVQLGFSACLRESIPAAFTTQRNNKKVAGSIGAVVFGSDQGLVGQFNDSVVDDAVKVLKALPGKLILWAVGERVHSRLIDVNLQPRGLFNVPTSVKAIAPLVGQILVESETQGGQDTIVDLYLFYNRLESGSFYVPVYQQLLPLDESWLRKILIIPWPGKNIPEVLGSPAIALRALIREYLFISLSQACAESLASENASRLAAMQRADKNIDELLHEFNMTFHRLRQEGIDEELFDIISGFESLSGKQ
jgi:F-type H+-transporting ATPase subunit gamma